MKKYIFAVLLSVCLLVNNSILAFSSTIETNDIVNWPTGPDLGAEAAFLMEANTGVILYAKNPHKKMYPASTTKLLTALLAAENAEMTDMVTFSHDAVFSLEPGSSNIGIDPGQAMPMEECLYGIMVGSANEVANAVAEHVGGSMEGFVDMMNKKVEELGLTDTHFTNANGLHDTEHYTSVYDLAMMAREFFNNDKLKDIGNTKSHHFTPTSTQPDDFYVRNKHKLINGNIPYEGIIGGKTGYTSDAKETLVTCAEANGMRLICVIMKEDDPEQYYDTVKLFDYGFGSFQVMNVSGNEDRYSVSTSNFFPSSVDILGNSQQILRLNKDDYIIMPKNVLFRELSSDVIYDGLDENVIARIDYNYHGQYLGYGNVEVNREQPVMSIFDEVIRDTKAEAGHEANQNIIYINVIRVVSIVAGAAFAIMLISTFISLIINYNLVDGAKKRRHDRQRRNRRSKNDISF